MAHVPERVELFVCEQCQAVYAGSVIKVEDGHRFEAPDTCAACAGDRFVGLHNWVHAGVQADG